ncbi:hypothetical protein [Bifidobacterium bombi]|uniref:Uncharacterized protein n=1 Tax=Bifidobacterium bombi DSM 19703 TaxID=1341695 RepID=A0A080N5V2_9BIFI|nr:hypothetical protein [Bifidobacterium bombi]KFF31029.1 hypothetical protein BBOMB_0359 [Bifidobacterium bombi DSM 19703]
MAVERGVRLELDSSFGAVEGVHADVRLRFDDDRLDVTLCDIPVSRVASDDGYEEYSAVVSMQAVVPDAQQRFKSILASLDSLTGNQVEGVSALYHVMNVDKPDGLSAVAIVSTRLDMQGFRTYLRALSDSQEGAVDLRLVDMHDPEGHSIAYGHGNESDGSDRVNDEDVQHDAAVLIPWLDMDTQARLGNDPVSYLLAFAPNSAQVGMLSEEWILGDTL